MSTQSAFEVPLLVSADQDQFRLIELPSELVDLLGSPAPPVLQFKSSEAGHASLCSSNKTFDLRQVQTSNSVHITIPSSNTGQLSRDSTLSGIISIAQCGSSLELVGQAKGNALEYLKGLLPIYREDSSETEHDSAQPRTKHDIFCGIPFSQSECERDWQTLCAFEVGSPARSFRPSPRLLVKAWSSIMSNAILDSADVANPISKDKLEGWLESIDDVPQSLLAVIVANLQDIEKDGMVSFSKIETVKFTGSQLLQDLVEVEEDEFRRQWCNLLPEKWRDAIDINELSIRWQSISGRKIRAVSSDGEKSAGNASTTSTTTTKRKWHEKFKQARKA